MNASGVPQWAWFDGRVVAFADARVPIEDRGLQFGESVYEVVAIVAGSAFRLPDHVARLGRSANEIGIGRGVPPLASWEEMIALLHRREPCRAGLLYAQLTGGSAPRQHLPAHPARPLFFAYLRPFDFPTPAEVSQGISLITVPESRWLRRDIKTTMLLPAVLARREAAERGAEEAVFVGQDGFVNDGASSTVFVVRSRIVTTPPATQRVLPGVSASVVAEICRELGLRLEARPLTLSDLTAADEIFVASTSQLLMPVTRLDGRPVARGVPGALTLQLAYHFQRAFWAPLQR